jgi:hypothetical protein
LLAATRRAAAGCVQQAAFLFLEEDHRYLVLHVHWGHIVIEDAPVLQGMVYASRVLILLPAVASMNAAQIVIIILTLRFKERLFALHATLQMVNTRTRGLLIVNKGSMIPFC